jgi:hypothetical protein
MLFQITWATRSSVHKSVEKPHARAPCRRAVCRRSRAAESRRGLRPARPAPLRPPLPARCQAACHRLAVCRLTFSRWTISACRRPCAKSFAASSRRASKAPKSRRGRMIVFMPEIYHIPGTVSLYYENIINNELPHNAPPCAFSYLYEPPRRVDRISRIRGHVSK